MSKLSPIFNDEQLDNNGIPLVGGQIIFYLAGTSTVVDTYTNIYGTALQTSPIILNYRGEPPYPIWLTENISYKARLFDVNGVLIREYDNITGINDTSSTTQSISEWVGSYDSTYISATSFSVTGDQTSIFLVNRRTKGQVTAGFSYGTITSSTFSAGITTVVQVNDSIPLDHGLVVTQYGILAPTPQSYLPSIPSGSKMTFFQASAPVGWTQIFTHNNRMMRVVDGFGGGFGGSDSPLLMNKVPSHTHFFTTGGESATHLHVYTEPSAAVASYGAGGLSAVPGTTLGATVANSSDHTHTGTTNTNGSASNWAPMYMDMILCQKD